MTAAELFQEVDAITARLPKCVQPILVRLIAMCFREGSNQVSISAYALADELGTSRDAVRVAMRTLSGVLTVENSPGVATRWTLPADWFLSQGTLFPTAAPVEKPPNQPGSSPGNQPGSQAGYRQPDELPGYQSPNQPGSQAGLSPTRRATRLLFNRWTSCQAGLPQPDELPGYHQTSYQAGSTHNQQHTVWWPGSQAGSLESSRKGLSVFEGVLLLQDSIESVKAVPEAFAADAEELKVHVRQYRGRHHPSHTIPEGPDAEILGKCLAVAPLAHLVNIIQTEEKKNHPMRPGDSWMWWVSIFCDRVHRIKGHDHRKRTPIREQFRQAQNEPPETPSYETAAAKPASAETQNREFGPQLINQVAGARKLR